MPSLKDKYSDTELDRSNKAFDEIVNQPDMQAVNDQGDATARELENAEKNLKAPEDFHEGDGKDAARRAEARNSDNPENQFYRPNDKTQATISRWSNKRKAGVFGGVGGAILAIVASSFMLLPLKIPGIMQMIADEAGQRVEQVTERRAKIILARAIVSKFGKNSGIVITGNGAVSTLVASMRTSRFESKLAAKGLTIEKSGDGGVRLRMNNELIGKGRSLRTDMEVLRAMEDNKLTNKMIKTIVKEEIPSWRLLKQVKFAKWLRIKYGVPKYGIKNSKNTDTDARVKEMQIARLTPEYEAVADNMANATDNLVEGNGDLDPNDPAPVHSTGVSNPVGDTARATIDETVDANSDPKSKTLKTLISNLSAKLSGKAIPIVGWIDLLATVDHILFETSEHDLIGKIATYYRAAQYSRHYAVWSGYGSQIQLGAMDPAFIGALASQTEGIEESQAFNMIEGNPERGTPVKNKINANQRTDFSNDMKEILDIFGGYGSIGGQSVHWVLDLWWQGSNKVFEFIGGILQYIAGLLSAVAPQALEDWLANLLGKVMTKLMEVMGLDFDPSVKGANWFNAAHGGATWTYNDFCRNEMGCRKLTPSQATQQNSAIAVDRAQYKREQGLMYALFSTETSTSISSQLAIHAPTSVTSFMSTIGRMVTDTPAKILGITTSKSSAAGYTDIHGVDPYGALDSDLNKPVDPKAISGEPCDEEPDGKSLDLCRTDTMVAEAMLCEFEPENAACATGITDPVDTDGAGAKFRISSFNIYYNTNDSDPDYSKGMWVERLSRSSKVIRDNHLEVVGLQEVRQDQWQRIQDNDMLGGQYDIYPKTYAAGGYGSQNPIVWDINVFELVEGKPIPGYQVLGPKNSDANIQVKLRYIATGQEIYVINHHEPVGTGDSIKARYDSAVERTAYAIDLRAKEKVPVFLTGDFNSGYDHRPPQPTYLGDRNNLAYCIFTANDLMWDAYDAAKNIKGKCPTRDAPGVDHIFMTTDVTASNWDYSIAPRGNGSDVHNTLFVDVEIPGDESGESTVGWQWPLKKDINNGPCYGGSSVHAGMDMNSSTTNNIVYAMHSGTVATIGTDDAAGNYITIKSDEDFEGKPVYYSFEHLKSGSIRVARNAKVMGGKPIAIAGLTGNVNVTTSKAHLHIVTATTNSLGSYGNLGTTFDPMKILKDVKPVPGGYKCT